MHVCIYSMHDSVLKFSDLLNDSIVYMIRFSRNDSLPPIFIFFFIILIISIQCFMFKNVK